MTSILTWNIQCGRGCDGRFDLARIARVAEAMGDSDVLCFQEVARNDPQYGDGADQLAELQALFPRHRAFFGAALDRPGTVAERRQFGNLLLSRLPVLQVFFHLLPHPAEGGIKHMQRQAIEAVVETRPLTVGLAIFGAPESGVDWSVISAGTIMAVAPLLVAFLLFQRQFMQSFMQAGIK